MQWGSRRALSHWRGHSGREAVLGIDGVRGDRGGARAEAEVAWPLGEEGSEENYSSGRPESDTWDHREAGGGAGVAARRAVARGGSGRQQVRRGEGRGGQRGVGEGGGEAGKGTWPGAGRR
jgi:hypothetical protein